MRFTICGYDQADATSSGTGAGLVRLVEHLASRGVICQVLILHLGDADRCPFIRILRQTPGLFCETAQIDAGLLHIHRQTRWILDRVRSFRPDVFCPNYAPPGLYAAQYTARAGVPTVVVIHSPNDFYRGVIGLLAERLIVPPPHVVTVSRYLGQWVEESGFPGDTSCISCGTPIPETMATAPAPDTLRVLYAGRLTDMQKRITDVVNAMCAIVRNLPDVHCSVYGNGPARDQVAESLAKSTLASRVTLQEPVPVTKIQSVMLNHHVFLLLSTHEGLPVALLEAMACGLVPICVRNTPGVEEVVTDGSNGLLIPDRNPNSVVEAVRRLRDEPGLWDRLSRNARQTVSEKYAVDVENTKWERLLGDLQTRKTGDLRRVPWRVRLPVEPLAEMDIRSAPFKQRLRHRRRAAWMALRLALRPRARLRAWLARRRGAEKSATGEA